MATRKFRKGDDDSSSKKDDDEDKFKENQFKSRKSVSKADSDDDDDDDDDKADKSRKSVRKADGDDDDDKDKKPWEKSDGDDDDDCKSRKSVRKSDDDDDEDDDEDDMNKKAKKSLSVGDLKKSMRMLKGFLNENDPSSRKEFLLSKAQESSLKKSERRELMALLEGDSPSNSRPESMTKSMNANETIQKSFDVTDFLHELTGELCKSHDALSDRLSKSQNSQGEFNIVLAKSVAAVGAQQLALTELLKSVAERIGVIEAQPARGPKSQGVQAMEKGFAGQAAGGQSRGGGNQLNKSQVLELLTSMNEESHNTGREGMSKSGEDLAHAISKYESTNIISKALESEVSQHIRSKRQNNRAN